MNLHPVLDVGVLLAAVVAIVRLVHAQSSATATMDAGLKGISEKLEEHKVIVADRQDSMHREIMGQLKAHENLVEVRHQENTRRLDRLEKLMDGKRR